EESQRWFPDTSTEGNQAILAAHFPWLKEEDIAPYLVTKCYGIGQEKWQELNIPARPGDEFSRFDECAVLDFLRLLSIRVELKNNYVTFLVPEWGSFWIRTS